MIVWRVYAHIVVERIEITLIVQQLICLVECLARGCREIVQRVIKVNEEVLVSLHHVVAFSLLFVGILFALLQGRVVALSAQWLVLHLLAQQHLLVVAHETV